MCILCRPPGPSKIYFRAQKADKSDYIPAQLEVLFEYQKQCWTRRESDKRARSSVAHLLHAEAINHVPHNWSYTGESTHRNIGRKALDEPERNQMKTEAYLWGAHKLTWQIPVSLACLCSSFWSSCSCKLITSSLVAGVEETLCLHNCPLSSHSLGGKMESKISSVSLLWASDSVSPLSESSFFFLPIW